MVKIADNRVVADSMSDSDLKEARLKKVCGEHHRLNLRVEELEHELDLLQASLSWKLTTPLRLVKPFIGYLRSLVSIGRHDMAPNPFSDLLMDGHSIVTGDTPYFILESSKRRMPVGWVEIELKMAGDEAHKEFAMYVDEGAGFSEQGRVNLSFRRTTKQLIKLPRIVKTLRLDPVTAGTKFIFHGLKAKEVSRLTVFFRMLLKRSAFEKARTGSIWGFVGDLFSVWLRGGLLAFKHFILLDKLSRKDYNRAYRKWVKKYDTLDDLERKRIRTCIEGFSDKPLISIVMPVYNTPEKWLRCAIDSVINQLYTNWELCISDDASTRPSVAQILKEYQLKDSRIKVVFREQNGHIAQSSNSALELATGQYVALMDHDDELPEHALYLVAREINLHPEVDLLFSDEDRISKKGERLDPYFKIGWNRELFLGQNCISHFGVYRTSIAKQVPQLLN